MSQAIEVRIEKTIAFICGDVLATVILWVHLDAAAIMVKLALTCVLGIVGGFAGLLGRDIYELIKTAIKQWHKRNPKNE